MTSDPSKETNEQQNDTQIRVASQAAIEVKLPLPLPEQREYIESLLDWQRRSYKPDALIGRSGIRVERG